MPSTKPINYIADRAKLSELSTTVKKSATKAEYASPFASTGDKISEKVSGPDLAEAYRAYNKLEEDARNVVAEANAQLAKTANKTEVDPSVYLG